MWHVGVNAHLLSSQVGYRSAGIHSYSYGLLRHLASAGGPFRYTAYVGRQAMVDLPGMEVRRSRLMTDRPPVRILWEQAFQPWAMAAGTIDLHHALAFAAPLACPCPMVVTVYDLSFVHTPRRFPRGRRLYLQTITRLSVHRARRVFAISESSAHDICQAYAVPRSRIEVIYPGVDPALRPPSPQAIACFRETHKLPPHFILFVGTLEPRKNLTRLLDAYARLVRTGFHAPPLYLAGGRGWMADEVFARVESLDLSSRVHFPGYLPAEELSLWYAAADLFVYPSIYEGFGMPVVEAMACGAPVVTTNVSSLPEAAGDAALFVRPDDSEALAEAIRTALTDETLRGELRQRGLAQAARFTWEQAAQQTVAAYRHVLEGDRGGAE